LAGSAAEEFVADVVELAGDALGVAGNDVEGFWGEGFGSVAFGFPF